MLQTVSEDLDKAGRQLVPISNQHRLISRLRLAAHIDRLHPEFSFVAIGFGR